jgi:hypothetical protein
MRGPQISRELRPEVVLEAKRLRRASPLNGKRRSFRKISRECVAKGYLSARGTPFSASAVRAMVEGPMPEKPSLNPSAQNWAPHVVCPATNGNDETQDDQGDETDQEHVLDQGSTALVTR